MSTMQKQDGYFNKFVRKLARMFVLPPAVSMDNLDFKDIPALPCDASSLLSKSAIDTQAVFESDDLHPLWNDAETKLRELGMPELTGGINPGDRRALFYLVSKLRPRSILEVGTHIGSSTTAIALALSAYCGEGGSAPITTVDIIDVNDESSKPWLQYQAKESPRGLLERLGCGRLVSFVAGKSLDYMRIYSNRRFDFIFLDGSHHAESVYREIPLALNLLNEGGVILLHDFFPDGKRLWDSSPIIPGPYLAVHRFLQEGAGIVAVPLGDLPWITKRDSHKTSLALLCRR